MSSDLKQLAKKLGYDYSAIEFIHNKVLKVKTIYLATFPGLNLPQGIIRKLLETGLEGDELRDHFSEMDISFESFSANNPEVLEYAESTRNEVHSFWRFMNESINSEVEKKSDDLKKLGSEVILFNLPSNSSFDTFQSIKSKLKNTDYNVYFYGTESTNEFIVQKQIFNGVETEIAEFLTFSQVVLTKQLDDISYLTLRGTEGLNAQVTNFQLVERVAKWSTLYDFELISAMDAVIRVRFSEKPSNVLEFVQEQIDICPSLVDTDQRVEDLAREIEETSYFGLWW